MAAAPASAALLARLEGISRERPDRVLRLQGSLVGDGGGLEPFELLIFRGFSSSLSHPTGFDPDRPALPADALIEAVELLAAPLDPSREQLLAGPEPVDRFLDPTGWA
jgi:hypothetical protein